MSRKWKIIGIVTISAVILLLALFFIQPLGILNGSAAPTECINKAEELGAPENVIALLKRPSDDLNFAERTIIRKSLEGLGIDDACGHVLGGDSNTAEEGGIVERIVDSGVDKVASLTLRVEDEVASRRGDETVLPTAEPQQPAPPQPPQPSSNLIPATPSPPEVPATAVPPTDAISNAAKNLLAQTESETALNTSISEDCLFAVVRAETSEAMLDKVRDANPAELSDLERYEWNLLFSRYHDDSDLRLGMSAYFSFPKRDLGKHEEMASACADLWTAPITEQNIDNRNNELVDFCSPLELLRYESDEYARLHTPMMRDVDSLLKRPYQSLTLTDRIVLRQSLSSDYCAMYYPQLYFERWTPMFMKILRDEDDNDAYTYTTLFNGKATYDEGDIFVAYPRGKPIICSEEELEMFGDHSYYPDNEHWEFDETARSCKLQPIARDGDYDNDYLEAGRGIRRRNGNVLVCHPGIDSDSGWRWDSESNSSWRCVRRF